jgi:hypothetical protein
MITQQRLNLGMWDLRMILYSAALALTGVWRVMKWMMMIECILVCSKDMGSSILSFVNEVHGSH